MQPYRLTLDKFLDHAAKWHSESQIVSVNHRKELSRSTYAELRAGSNALSGALTDLGLLPGDRLATLAWNTRDHLEAWYAAMGAGFVCHTLNPRLRIEQLAAMVNEAHDRLLLVAGGLDETAEQLVHACPSIEQVVFLDDAETPPTRWSWQSLRQKLGRPVAWGNFDEHSAAGLCYTSGTTAAPKGVLYTHRSNYLHTLRLLQADALGLSSKDCVLVAVPMFHANGWGFPFAAPAVGAKLVLPGRHLDGRSIVELMSREGVTVAAGVPTVWIGVLDELDHSGLKLPALQRIIVGGSSCPDTLIDRIERTLGASVQTSWGMTELSPLGTVSPPSMRRAVRGTSGRPPMGLDLKLTDAAGITLPQQRDAIGHLKVKGASVVGRYFGNPASVLDEDGYFDTGDLARIDIDGNLTITGRSKDLIKSGGEWINPAQIEEIIGSVAAVGLAAVIGRPDAKWGERPILIVELRPGYAIDDRTLLDRLRGHVADFWIPERVIRVARMPLAATGKIDKAQLRAEYADL